MADRGPSSAPLLLAHRGDWRGGPENSLGALLAGTRLPGCDGVEFDVRISSDGVPVVIHDATLDRVQGRPGRVADLPAAELAAAGVPTLAEVLAALPAGAFLDVELKGADHGDATAAALEAGRGAAPARAVVSSFEPATLAAMRARLPGWRRWLNADDLESTTIGTARDLGCAAIAAELGSITTEAIGRAHAAGLAVAAWTARTTVETHRAAALGVVAICGEGPGVSRPIALEADGARLLVCPEVGGRIASLVVGGRELLLTEGYGPIMWGSYPMAPWAGRIRNARLRFGGREHQLRANDPPHALHGTVFDRPWTVTGPDTLAIDLGEGWPFAGRVTQRFSLTPSSMTVTMTLEADEPMPAVVGWHPWFRRRLLAANGAGEPSAEVRLAFAPGAMYERDTGGLPTGRLVEPGAPPWDDCFRDVAAPPVLTWPDVLALRVESDLDHVVVYSRPEHALCVEPQSGPPDGPNLAARVVTPGAPLTAWMTFRWWTPGETPPQPRSGTTSGGTSQRSTPRP